MNTYTAYHVFIKLVIGGLNYLVCKLTLDSFKKEAHQESKPGLMTLSTFLSLFFVALPLILSEYRERRAAGSIKGGLYSWATHGTLAIAGTLEMVAVYLSMYGNTVLPASMLVFMKATRVLWSALLSKHILKRKLYGHHWVGVALTFIGLIPIAGVTIMHSKPKADVPQWLQYAALAMVFFCEFFRAVRIIIEERLLKEKGVTPTFVQYVEGYSGLTLALILIAVLQGIGKENTADSFQAMGEHWPIMVLFGMHTLFHGLVNYSSTVVTKLMSSVHNAIISEMRIIVVWAPEFIIGAMYAIGQGKDREAKYGKLFHLDYLFDIPGFAIVVASALIYNGTMKLPFKGLYPRETKETVSPSTQDGNLERATA